MGISVRYAAQRAQNAPIIFSNRHLSSNSVETYSYAVREYRKFLNERKQHVDSRSVRDFLEVVRSTRSPRTFNLYRQALKEWLSGVFEADHKQLFGVLQLFKSTKRTITKGSVLRHKFLTRDEIDSISRKLATEGASGNRGMLLIQALFWSGLRISELLSIKLTDIKLKDTAIISITGKGQKTHTVYLQLELCNRIRNHFKGKCYLFETRNHTPLSRKNVTRDVKRHLARFGFQGSSHTLRHSKAMYLKDVRNLSADQVQKALNHATVKTTLESYFHGEPTASDMGLAEKWCF